MSENQAMIQKHTGGKLLQTGLHGCVFDTIPRCKGRARTIRDGRYSRDKRRTRRVVKLLDIKDKTVGTELLVSRQLAQMPNYADYFILIDDVCLGDDMSQNVDWSKCGLFKQGPKRLAPFVQLRMKYGGMRLTEYALNINKLLKNWINIQVHLAEALHILHSHNWVHGDFHFGNIVVDDKNVARIIDFGLTYNVNTIQDKHVVNMTFLPTYDNYAPELDFLSGSFSIHDKRELVNAIYRRKNILKEIDEAFPTSMGTLGEMINFAERVDIRGVGDAVVFLQKYGTLSDMWTFGYDFYKLYMLMLSVPEVIDSKFYKYHNGDQMRILRGLLQVDPRKRLTSEQLLTELYSLRMAQQQELD
jgi:serine/threonine protein kinase